MNLSQSYYRQSLGTAGHRVPSSYSYMPQYTPNSYYQHGPSVSMYSGVQLPQMPQVPYAPHSQPKTMSGPDQCQAQVGGINPISDYDLNNMSTFLSWCSFGMLKQNRNPSKEFENLVLSVLYATRLPKSTIVIALEYMNQRFSNKNFNFLSESDIFLKLTIALILGNKFNDDNTFTNKSWSGATGLSCTLLNTEEMEWLKDIKWQLNVVNFEENIKTLEECWKTWLKKYSHRIMPLTPNLQLSDPFNYPYSSIPSSPSYVEHRSSPLSSSPVKYSRDTIWSQNHSNHNDFWTYTPNYQYVPNQGIFASDPAVQYIGSANNFVGYTNPYYGFNMASC